MRSLNDAIMKAASSSFMSGGGGGGRHPPPTQSGGGGRFRAGGKVCEMFLKGKCRDDDCRYSHSIPNKPQGVF